MFRLQIERLDERGDGVAFLDAAIGPQKMPMRFDFHVRRAVPGDVVDAQVSGIRRRRVDAWVHDFVEPSPKRIPAPCAHFESDGERPGCGGCSLQSLELLDQHALKRARLQRLFRQHELDAGLIEPVQIAGDGWFYRNKMEFSFAGGNERDRLGLGMHPGGFKYEVIDHEHCLLMSQFVSDFIPRATEWAQQFDLPAFRAGHGFWRNIIVREGKNTGERLIELVTSHLEPEAGEQIAHRFVEFVGTDATSVYWSEVRAMRGERTQRTEHHLAGRETLREELTINGRTLGFEIAPTAFFQTNTVGAELLYSMVVEHAAPGGDEQVLDLYAGTGTIGLCLAPSAAHVVGVELVQAAVENALANARLNAIQNVEYFAGDVGDVLAERGLQADVVVVDPPRAGLLPAAHTQLDQIDAHRLVYVSCNPQALARDLVALSERWTIERVRPVDMFPQTAHVETVVCLGRR